METAQIVEAFSADAEMRFGRIKHQLEPLPADAQAFIARLKKNKSGASVAYGRDGDGGHYEQVFFDYAVVLDAAETIWAQAQQVLQADGPASGGSAA
ncbi:MAG: hypothetical protein NTW01_13520 [Gammaproteobacteria bacterium]|nr:hypothetical protein [Gammaproteobacteria bacterium]